MILTLLSAGVFLGLLGLTTYRGVGSMRSSGISMLYHAASIGVSAYAFWKGTGLMLDYARGYALGWALSLVMILLGAFVFWSMKKLRKVRVEEVTP